MGCLVFNKDTKVHPYNELYDLKRWDYLKDEFNKNLFKIFNLTEISPLIILMQIGISVLKLPQSFENPNVKFLLIILYYLDK
jgi:hypothetical protein